MNPRNNPPTVTDQDDTELMRQYDPSVWRPQPKLTPGPRPKRTLGHRLVDVVIVLGCIVVAILAALMLFGVQG